MPARFTRGPPQTEAGREAWVRRRTRRLTAGAGKARLPVPLIVT